LKNAFRSLFTLFEEKKKKKKSNAKLPILSLSQTFKAAKVKIEIESV
jgi:hypothetical protein